MRSVAMQNPGEMRDGAAISAALHLGILLLMLFGADLFPDRATVPFTITEVELVDGTNFDAALSGAPVVVKDAPDQPTPKPEKEVKPIDLAAPDVAIAVPDMPVLTETEQPTEAQPDFNAILVPPPPTVVPTEAPRPSIALIPSLDPVRRQAATPESAPSTEPVQALASVSAPEAAPRPFAPPEPEPVADPKPETAPVEERAPETEAKPEAAPEAPDPTEQPVADAGQDAPLAVAPREARLPVAKPAKTVAAAPASSAPKPVAVTPDKPKEPEPAAQPKPAEQAPAAASQFASAITIGEKDALRLGIKKYFTYNGNRADRSLQVTIRIRMAQDATIVGSPELLRASGGDAGAQDVLFRAGRRALLMAQSAGEFKKLPPDKFAGWQLIHVTFTPEEIGFAS